MALKIKRTSFKEFSGEKKKKFFQNIFPPETLVLPLKNKQKNLEDFFFVKAVICKINKVFKIHIDIERVRE